MYNGADTVPLRGIGRVLQKEKIVKKKRKRTTKKTNTASFSAAVKGIRRGDF